MQQGWRSPCDGDVKVDEPGTTSASRRSRLTDIADQTVIVAPIAAAPVQNSEESVPPPAEQPVPDQDDAQIQARWRQFLDQLGEFRRSQVLVPLGTLPGGRGGEAPLTVDVGGLRWILAFTDEAALARYALARGEAEREWPYWGVWGAALLDAAVPTVAESGMPCGVLLNAADGEHGLVLPPVAGVVPEDVAVNGPGTALSRTDATEEGE